MLEKNADATCNCSFSSDFADKSCNVNIISIEINWDLYVVTSFFQWKKLQFSHVRGTSKGQGTIRILRI